MPQSNCPRCGSIKFEAVLAQDIKGIKRSIVFIQCEQCGAVVGALDFVNLGVQALNLRDEVNRVVERIRYNLEK
jgi:uncharacterized Zn finger protein